MESMTVFEFLYCSCIHESAMVTISIHETKKGAVTAMKIHKDQKKREWEKLYSTQEERKIATPFDKMKRWNIVKTKVEP